MQVVRDRAARWVRIAAPAGVLVVAALFRFWALGRPDTLVFDELYYVRDAVSQLTHGVPTTWPDDDPAFSGAHAAAFSEVASTVAHPPLGKWLIGLGILLFGPETGWGWRSAVAAAGVATVGVVMLLAWAMTRRLAVACTAGLLLALDGVHVVLTRVSILDGFLTLFIALGALFMWHDLHRPEQSSRGWRRPWLVAAGMTFGAAAAVKWSGLYPLVAFLALSVAAEWIRRRRGGARRPVWGALARGAAASAVALVAAFAVYLASWWGWIAGTNLGHRVEGQPWWVSLAEWHGDSVAWHATLSAPHPYQAHPLTWPLGLRPTAMYESTWEAGANCPWPEGCAAVVAPLPNLLITWGGVAALLLLGWMLVRLAARAMRRGDPLPVASPDLRAGAFVLVGYLSGWIPWLLTPSRSAVFQFYAVALTPFAAIALALVLGAVAQGHRPSSVLALSGIRLDDAPAAIRGRQLAVAVFLLVATVVSVLFFPVWSGAPVAEWFWRAHLWLPGWD